MTTLLQNAPLTLKLARREFDQRFRGSMLGWFWALIAPLAMLAVFSLVFGVIFQSRWQRPGTEMQAEFAFPLLLFSGLILFNFFADQFNRAPTLMMENVSYIKKVVFPLEIMPIVSMLTALATAAISFIAFLVIYVIMHGVPPLTILLLPFAVLPLALLSLGISYFLSSLGVFLRDLKHVTPPLSTALLFLSAVFYQPENLPKPYDAIVWMNPLTPAVTYMRDLVFWGRLPDPFAYIAYLLFSMIVFMLGFAWFKRTQKAFADVI
ncbi:ABC transporter permease [Aureimonas mangrovi]|uniref:ABC transporter permease n=1 Tax=Aureimonas mangrovi TaxID=2758041 RepID=UPI00163DB83E|nr:ABC transporter permease [Aureimonas mangrovi]